MSHDHVACILCGKDWKPGSAPPESEHDYLGWQEWAEVQHKAGLRQKQCGHCAKWWFPQELSDQTIESTMYTSRGKPVHISSPICAKCARASANAPIEDGARGEG